MPNGPSSQIADMKPNPSPDVTERPESPNSDSVQRVVSRIRGFHHKSFEAWCPVHGRGLCVFEWSGSSILESVNHQTCHKCDQKMTVRMQPVNSEGWTRQVVYAVAWDNFIGHPITILVIAAIIAAIVRTLLFG